MCVCVRLFGDYLGVILEVCETIWGSFGKCFGRILKKKRQKNYSENRKNYKNLIVYYLNIALNSLFNE